VPIDIKMYTQAHQGPYMNCEIFVKDVSRGVELLKHLSYKD